MTIIEAQREIAKILREGGVENAMNEARFFLQDALGYNSVQLVTGYRNYACQSCVEAAFTSTSGLRRMPDNSSWQ